MSEPSIIARQCPCCSGKSLDKSSAILMPFVAHRALGWRPTRIDETWGLRTIENGMAYPLCNSVLCRECFFLFLDLRFSHSELSELYSGYRGPEYVELRESYEPGYQLRNKVFEGHRHPYISQIEEFLSRFVRPQAKILDWGGDNGQNSPFLNQCSSLHILDISQKPLVHGAIAVDPKTAARESYDLVVCSQVLEHLPYPLETLLEIKNCMQKETVLYIELPLEELVRTSTNYDSLLKHKKHWHEHINFFSESSLKALIKRAKLNLIAFQETQISMGEQNPWIYQAVCQI